MKNTFLFLKVEPGQMFPWVKAGKNPLRHVIAYTPNMNKVMII
jgi:hypothetical protein